MTQTSLLIRGARLVPVGGVPAPRDGGPLDVRVVGGRVTDVATGLRAESADEVLEADGRWLMPGLWDQHVHFGQWAASASRLDLSGTESADEVVRCVAAEVDARAGGAPGTVLQAYGHRTGAWSRQPTVAELDAVTGDLPVVLISGDAHHGWLNSAALRLLDLSLRDTVVEENEWFASFARLEEVTRSMQDRRTAYAKALDAALRRGVVGVAEMEWADNADEWVERSASGLAPLRVRTATYAVGLAETIAAGRRTGQVLDEAGLVTMGPLKIISDGSLNTRTAWCHEPYVGGEELDAPRGRPNNSPAELVELLATATAHGLDVAVHAIGDAAVDSALDAFSHTGARGSIEHAQLVAAGAVDRMARLGVVASVQPSHLLDDRDVTQQCWPDRADRCFPLRSMLDAGVRLALGSDAPVAPLDPWESMAAAVHRSADEREPWNVAESLTVAEALAASTDGASTVAAGSRGDLLLVDEDPFAAGDAGPAAAGHLRAVTVAATIVNGVVRHRA
ncbi:hypothetical protein BCF74_10113 [Knoellia remsis]|uniref:Amidohydrolase 3 domain-containing protein n=1 Tax=Knoellia remsis TaxID=407159 RepID=A0A2T0V0A1_9MICO|nr:amidohydrolase family protein [Knoellia remsis]PRY63615.1 hypothetical protein BCF74_10113 [Knoellia remsis]